MFLFIYTRPIITVIEMILAFLIFYFILNVLFDGTKWIKILNVVGFIISILGILYITVFSREVGSYDLELRPFYSFVLTKTNSGMARSMFMNVVLYVPFGACLMFVLPHKAKVLKELVTTLSAALTSLFTECIQLFFSLGRCEVDDVIFNMIGAIIGVIAVIIFAHLFRELE